MAVTHGARTEVVRHIGESFGREAHTIEQVHLHATRAVTALSEVWRGPDASRYAARWTAQERALLDASQRLFDMAEQLGAQANQQTQTSGTAGWGPGGGPVGPGGGPVGPGTPTNPLPPQGAGINESLRGTEGMPEDLTMWTLSWATYGDENQRMLREGIEPPPLPDGWREARPDELPPGVVLEDEDTGFAATVYVNEDGQYVIAYRGSDNDPDWPQNFMQGAGITSEVGVEIGQGAAQWGERIDGLLTTVGAGAGALLGLHVGLPGLGAQLGAHVGHGAGQGIEDKLTAGGAYVAGHTQQYEQAMALAVAMKEHVGAENLAMTGHSLGGGLASVAAMATDTPAVTFDASGPHPNTAEMAANYRNDGSTGESVMAEASQGQIRAYRIENDILTGLQERYASAPFAPDAVGTPITLAPVNTPAADNFAAEWGNAAGAGFDWASPYTSSVPIFGPAVDHVLAPVAVGLANLATGQDVASTAVDMGQAFLDPRGEVVEVGTTVGYDAYGHHWLSIEQRMRERYDN